MVAGFLVAGVQRGSAGVDRRVLLRDAALFGAAGAAADLDLLVGAHSGPSHGLGAAVLVGVAIFIAQRRWPAVFPKSAVGLVPLAMAVAYASHTLLDWLGTDSRAPIGIMALWPLTREYYESSLHVFMGVSRRYWLPGFWRHNLLALLRELAILLPTLGLVLAVREWLPRVLRRHPPHA
jgi:hypothetical protein